MLCNEYEWMLNRQKLFFTNMCCIEYDNFIMVQLVAIPYDGHKFPNSLK